MKFRKEIEADILKFAEAASKSGHNKKLYEDLFSKLSDDQFKQFWKGICDSGFIPVFMNNFDINEMVDYDKVVKFGKENGIELEQYAILTDPDTGLEHQLPETAFFGTIECRKQRQMQVKKIGVAKHDHDVEDLTGQPTGDSRAGGVTDPEIQVLLSLGLTTMCKELTDVLGGDSGAYKAYKNDILTGGETTIQSSLKRGTGVKSLSTVHFLLRGAGLDNNFNDR